MTDVVLEEKFQNNEFLEIQPERLKELFEISQKLPKDPSSDWNGTNHYEFNGYVEERDFWTWWELGNDIPEGDISNTVWGQRLGYIMDAASALPEAIQQIKSLTFKANAFENSAKYYQKHIKEIERILGKTKVEVSDKSIRIVGPSTYVKRMDQYNKNLEEIILKLNTNKKNELTDSQKKIVLNILSGKENGK